MLKVKMERGLGFYIDLELLTNQIEDEKLVPGAGTDSSRVPASWEEIWPLYSSTMSSMINKNYALIKSKI